MLRIGKARVYRQTGSCSYSMKWQALIHFGYIYQTMRIAQQLRSSDADAY